MSSAMNFHSVNEEVFYTTEAVTKVGRDVIAWLKERARGKAISPPF